jgi:response regulator RpfG family c-di-GMP phosphodiesterase
MGRIGVKRKGRSMEEPENNVTQNRPTILLVDDEESILNSLRRFLRSQPYEIWKSLSSGRWMWS